MKSTAYIVAVVLLIVLPVIAVAIGSAFGVRPDVLILLGVLLALLVHTVRTERRMD